MSVQRGAWGLCLLGATLISFAPPVSAEIYQWKDEQGKTVFSERPPPGSDAKVVTPKTGKPSSNAREKLRQDRERIVPSAEKPTKQQPKELTEEQIEQKAEACAQARDALALLQANNRPRYETEDGKIAHMSPEMQAERVADAEKKVSDYCN
jgi:transposase